MKGYTMTKDERAQLITGNPDVLLDDFPEASHWDIKACLLLEDLIDKIEELVEATKAAKA